MPGKTKEKVETLSNMVQSQFNVVHARLDRIHDQDVPARLEDIDEAVLALEGGRKLANARLQELEGSLPSVLSVIADVSKRLGEIEGAGTALDELRAAIDRRFEKLEDDVENGRTITNRNTDVLNECQEVLDHNAEVLRETIESAEGYLDRHAKILLSLIYQVEGAAHRRKRLQARVNKLESDLYCDEQQREANIYGNEFPNGYSEDADRDYPRDGVMYDQDFYIRTPWGFVEQPTASGNASSARTANLKNFRDRA